ncbi:hypothetical protein FACS189476_02760 [Spirochaetia bacterium]|nr:hypothetical protein FACS189476_02760 [Spirochaetia bacterium]
MKKMILALLILNSTFIAFTQEKVTIWNFGGDTGTRSIDSCSWSIKRDFEGNGYYSWVSYQADLLNKEPTDTYQSDWYRKCDYPRSGSRKSRIMWECINEAIKKLGIKSGDFFRINISIERGTGSEPDDFPSGKGGCMYHFEGQLTNDNSINGRIYEGTYSFVNWGFF